MMPDEEREEDEVPLPLGEMDSAVDPVQRRRKQRKAARKEDEKAEFWRRIFATPVGRAEMWDILDSAHTFEEKFACGPTGFPYPEAAWFEAGIQSFGHRLYLSWLKLNRDGVNLMLEEHEPRMAKAKR